MAAPTLAGLAAQVAALQTQVAVLAVKVAALQESDAASGWAKWREQQQSGTTSS